MTKLHLVLGTSVNMSDSEDRIEEREWDEVVSSRAVEVVGSAHSWIAWSCESPDEAKRKLAEFESDPNNSDNFYSLDSVDC